jgi:hypothetical protein
MQKKDSQKKKKEEGTGTFIFGLIIVLACIIGIMATNGNALLEFSGGFRSKSIPFIFFLLLGLLMIFSSPNKKEK